LQIPILGFIIPRMGISKNAGSLKSTARHKHDAALRTKKRLASAKTSITVTPSSIADALLTTTQQRVLGLLFGQPDRSFFATEMIMLGGGGSGATQRELARLEATGLVTTSRHGNQKHYQANAASPIYEELTRIIAKTIDIAVPTRAVKNA
jgi:hypothetical protein